MSAGGVRGTGYGTGERKIPASLAQWRHSRAASVQVADPKAWDHASCKPTVSGSNPPTGSHVDKGIAAPG